MIVKDDIKNKLQIKTDIETIVISDGLKTHLINHNHSNVLKYYDKIEYIVNNPDYIGSSPREKGISLEYVKQLEENLLVAIKLDTKNGYFYVASFYEVTDSKLKSMIQSGRLKKYELDN